jgi:hypothetical protein
MEKVVGTVMASFAMPQTLLQEIKLVAVNEDLNLSILLRKMVRDWLRKYEFNKNEEAKKI